MKQNLFRTNVRSRRKRQGTATVELALTLPVLAVLVIGAIEGASMIFLRQALVQSAYEVVKESVRPDGDKALALEKGNQVLSFRNIAGTNIDISPSDVESLDRGTPVTVTVAAPSDAKSIIPFGPFQGKTIEVEATMLKE
ncbi:MAG: pilus assembly protein [Pirellulaceae bacterium]